ncbi:MAG: OadG family protein, partial [bacterium]|nr:OadG family protein [bacterium]
TYLVPGLVVVMSLLILLALSVEFISWFDNVLKAREQAKAASEEAVSATHEATPAEEVKADYSGETATAIALALHQHFTARRRSMAAGAGRQRGMVSWATSGRLEIMTARQSVPGRPKHVKQ